MGYQQFKSSWIGCHLVRRMRPENSSAKMSVKIVVWIHPPSSYSFGCLHCALPELNYQHGQPETTNVCGEGFKSFQPNWSFDHKFNFNFNFRFKIFFDHRTACGTVTCCGPCATTTGGTGETGGTAADTTTTQPPPSNRSIIWTDNSSRTTTPAICQGNRH